MQIIREWAGRERVFSLTFGAVMDLEEALGKTPIGEIFQRVSMGRFSVSDIYHTLRIALIDGGMPLLEATTLVRDRFDTRSYMSHAEIVGDILISLMSGVEPVDQVKNDEPAKPAEAFKFSEVSQICRVFNMSPADLRAMSYADFINLTRGFNAGSEKKAEFLTEEEHDEILAKYEPEALNGTVS